MLVTIVVGSLALVVGAVYIIIRKKDDSDDYVDGSTLSYDDIYPSVLTQPVEPTPPVVEAPVKKKRAKKVVAKKKGTKKRGRPAKGK